MDQPEPPKRPPVLFPGPEQKEKNMSMEKTPGPMDEAVLATVRTVARDARMQKALAIAHDRAEEAMALQVHISEVPAPTFEEHTRAEEIVRLMKEAGLKDVSIDEIGNVVGRRPGRNPEGPLLAIGAHMDTVFPAGTDVTVRREGNTYYGPGIGDNASGVRTVLEAVRALNEAGVETQGDIWFCTTVGEEGLGDIRGSKHLFREKNAVNKIDGFLAVDNSNIGRILFGAIGSHRWRFTVKGPGGHSYGAFGETPSAIHALCLAGAKVARLKVPETPRTTFTIGTIRGGTSVNTIAAAASCDVDIRSLGDRELLDAEAAIRAAFEEAVREENEIWGVTDPKKMVRLEAEMIGNRPAGTRPDDCPVLQASRAAQAELGLELTDYMSSSTDANAPVSLGIPATCLSSGGRQMRTHTVDEFYECFDIHLGPQLLMLTAVSLAGLAAQDGGEATKPILPVRS